MVCSVDALASEAGVALLRAGGSAADAAVGTSAVLAVTTQHLCGMGGDLFALVHAGSGPPAVLNASGRAGSALDAVAPVKQQQVRRIAAAWLAEVADRPRSAELRFDVIGVTIDASGDLLRLDHLEGAF